MAVTLFGIKIPIVGVDKLTKELGIAQKKLNTFGQNATKVGRTMSIGFTAPFALFTGSVIKTAGDFESSMNRVSALTGAVGGDFDQLRKKARDLGATTQFSASEAADAMGFLGMAGFDSNQILTSMGDTLNLAAAGQMELGRTADIASNIMTGFGKNASDMDDIANALVATFTKSNTNLEQLGEGMKFVAPVAAGMGIEMNEVAAAMGKLGDAGIQGSMAGTSLRGALSKLASPSREAVKVLQRLGIRREDLLDAEGNVLSLTNTIQVLEKAGAGADEMLEIFGDRAGPGMTALVNQGSGALIALRNEIDGAGGIAEKVAKKQMEGFNGQMKSLKSAFDELKIAIADSGLLAFVTDMVEKLTGFLRELSKANPAFLKWGMIIGAVVAAIGPMLLVLGTLATSISSIIALLTGPFVAGLIAAAAPIVAFLAPILAVIAAVLVWANVMRLIIQNWDNFAKPWEDFGIFVKALGFFFGDLLKDLLGFAAALARFILPKWLERLIGLSPSIAEEAVASGEAASIGAQAAAGAALGGTSTTTNNAAVDVTFRNAPPGTRTAIAGGDNVTTTMQGGPLPATAQ